MLKKYMIKGTIEVVTGLHIGTGGEFSAIGTVDSPVVRDAVSGKPMIPGSSLKGKLRTLVAMQHNDKLCEVKDDCDKIKRLFGGTIGDDKYTSRLIFSDVIMRNFDELWSRGISATETKFENTIDRITGAANPRQIERVIRGAEFDLEIIYNCTDDADPEQDLNMLADGIKLLQLDYLGGSGSRGYGKLRIYDLGIEQVTGDKDEELNARIKDVIKRADDVQAI